nr:EOG090X05UC [Eulimnadia texana]
MSTPLSRSIVFRHICNRWLSVSITNKVQYTRATNKLPAALDGLRVLDLTRVLAGPFCTMMLGDLGAEVIKVEKPKTGDDTRAWGPPFQNGQSCYFLCVNRNKKSICVDMKSQRGKGLVTELAAASDILVENYLPGKLDKMGLGYEQLRQINPRLIYCSITGYGSSGPYSSRPGYDVIAASIGGLLHITGPENGDPCKAGVALTDISTGLYAHGAIMAALFQRERSGKGQLIEVNLLSTQVASLVNLASNYLNAGKEAKRWGTAHESIVPYQSFATLDGYITVGAGNDKQFGSSAGPSAGKRTSWLPRSELLQHNGLRVVERDTIFIVLLKTEAEATQREWKKSLLNVAFSNRPVCTIRRYFEKKQADYADVCFKHFGDDDVKLSRDPTWYGSASSWLKVTPFGIRRVLNWIKNNFNSPEIVITENGYSDGAGNTDDLMRIYYYKHYINNVLKAIQDGVKVTGYFAWSLMDNFEWADGYT